MHKIFSVLKHVLPQKPVKVNFFILGAQKAGTSALHTYLCMHPNISGGNKKEMNFFNNPDNFSKGYDWYHQQFPTRTFNYFDKYLDASPRYLSEAGVAEKIFQYNPKAKLIIILRNPIKRAFSAWNMYSNFNKLSKEQKEKLISKRNLNYNKEEFISLIYSEPFPTFHEMAVNEITALKNKETKFPDIIKRGIYADEIEIYTKLFPKESIYIIEDNDLKTEKKESLDKLFDFLEVDKSKFRIGEENLKNIHSRKYEETISPDTELILKEFFAEHNERLYKLIGCQFSWNN